MNKLTKRQQQVLDYIKHHQADTGFPPTRQEIATHMGFRSPNAAEEHLRALHRKNVIEVISGTSRGIRVLEEPKGLPLIGQVAAGDPILAEQNIEDYVEMPSNTFKPHAHYVLRVKGDSMKDVGIFDGDLLAVHQSKEAHSGQIVVARIQDEVTVKTYKPTQSKVVLLPANDAYEPIEVEPQDHSFNIEGIAVGVIRTQMTLMQI